MNSSSNNAMFHVKQQQLSLTEIMEKMASVDETEIDRTAFRYENSQELTTMIEASEIPDANARFTITCCKSGCFIRAIGIEEFSILENIHGSEKAIEIIELRCTTHVAAHWLQTDGKTLEKLAQHDPYGYYIYAIDKVLRGAQDIFINYNKIDNVTQKMALEYKWHRQKALARKEIEEQPVEKVIKANELMRRYLSIIQTEYARNVVTFDTTNIIEISEHRLLTFINNIQDNIRAVLQWAWKRNRIRRDLTIDDIIKLRNIFKGHSNFAIQRKQSNIPNYERIIDELTPFFDDATMRRLHQPRITDEQLKEIQTGRVKSNTLAAGTTFKLKVAK